MNRTEELTLINHLNLFSNNTTYQGSQVFDWSICPPLFAKPRDTITWAWHQMRSPAITFHTIRPSGQKIYLILFIKYDLSILWKNKNKHGVAEKISDFLNISILFSKFFDAFPKANLNLKLKFYAKNYNISKIFSIIWQFVSLTTHRCYHIFEKQILKKEF